MKVVVATTNAGKLRELQALFAKLPLIELVSLSECPPVPKVIEDAETFAGNARKKATETARALGLACLADDSGLECDALRGAPGVHSARFAGPEASDADNVALVLERLNHMSDRRARFRCVLVLVDAKGTVVHETNGLVDGAILEAPRGEGGFGYDPVFVPDGHRETLAELSEDVKNTLSHRARAAESMRTWLIAHPAALEPKVV